LLAGLSLVAFAFEPKNRAYPWLSAALVVHALLRVNRVIFYWTHWATASTLEIARVVVAPSTLAARVVTWRAWFDVRRPPWLPRATAALALLLAASLAAGRAMAIVQTGARCALLALVVYLALAGARRLGRRGGPALPAVLVGLVAQFAPEWNALRLPGIWFPFEVGGARIQYALAGLIVLLTALPVGRLLSIERARGRASRPRRASRPWCARNGEETPIPDTTSSSSGDGKRVLVWRRIPADERGVAAAPRRARFGPPSPSVRPASDGGALKRGALDGARRVHVARVAALLCFRAPFGAGRARGVDIHVHVGAGRDLDLVVSGRAPRGAQGASSGVAPLRRRRRSAPRASGAARFEGAGHGDCSAHGPALAAAG
jgi:hypothetical protein